MSVSAHEQLARLNRLYKVGNELYYKTARELGLSDSALMILYGLCYAGKPCTQKELCETWYLKKQTLHSALNHLIASGEVRMEPLPENSRIKLIVLTEKGKVLCDKTAIPFLKASEKAFVRLSPDEREILLSLTQKHTDFIQEEAENLLSRHCESAE